MALDLDSNAFKRPRSSLGLSTHGGPLTWCSSLAQPRRPTGPGTRLGTPPTPGAPARPCGSAGTRGSPEALHVRGDPGLRGSPALPKGGDPRAHGRRCPSTGGTPGLTGGPTRPQGDPPGLSGGPTRPQETTSSRGGPTRPQGDPGCRAPSTGGPPGLTRRPRRPCPHPARLTRHTSLVPAAATPQFRTARKQRLRELRGRVPAVSNSPR